MIYRIPIEQARAGDILLFKRSGILSFSLAWMIKTIKEPSWDMAWWHMAPMISDDKYADAQWPRVKISSLLTAISKGKEIRAYRIMESPPPQEKTDCFVKNTIGQLYDAPVYLWTALRKLGIPIPRLINKWYDCWEVAYCAMDYWDCEIDPSDWNYPFITDFLRYAGEL